MAVLSLDFFGLWSVIAFVQNSRRAVASPLLTQPPCRRRIKAEMSHRREKRWAGSNAFGVRNRGRRQETFCLRRTWKGLFQRFLETAPRTNSAPAAATPLSTDNGPGCCGKVFGVMRAVGPVVQQATNNDPSTPHSVSRRARPTAEDRLVNADFNAPSSQTLDQ